MMEFDRKFKYGNDEWDCYSAKRMRTINKQARYKVVGEITSKKVENPNLSSYSSEGKKLYIQPMETHNHFLYRPYGYIPINEDNYVVAKKSNLLYIMLLLLLFIALIVGMFWNFSTNRPPLDPNADDYQSALKRPADWDSSSILIPGFDDLKMAAGTDVIYVVFNNPDENPCYFQYSIVLKETDETIYESGLIPPNKAVTEEKLTKSLKEGVHPVTIKINTYSLEDYEQRLNGGVVETNIIAIEQ